MNVFIDIEYPMQLDPLQPLIPLFREQECDRQIVYKKTYAKKASKPQGKTRYHWTRVEQKRYVDFLVKNQDTFDMSANDRRMTGINTKMSRAIKSRDTNQCRSHHQKMLTKFNSIRRIVTEFLCLLSPKNLKKWNSFDSNSQELQVLQNEVHSTNESISSFEREKYRQKVSNSQTVHFFHIQSSSLLEESLFKEETP